MRRGSLRGGNSKCVVTEFQLCEMLSVLRLSGISVGRVVHELAATHTTQEIVHASRRHNANVQESGRMTPIEMKLRLRLQWPKCVSDGQSAEDQAAADQGGDAN
jgi:hypothetical protein